MLSVTGDDRLAATVLAFKAADRGLRASINAATRTTVGPVWTSAVNGNARTAQDRRILATGARIKAGNPPAAIAATSTRALSGGLVPSTDWTIYEFGTNNPQRVTSYRSRSRKGKAYTVRNRHTRRQLPARDAGGRVIYKALKEVAPKAVSLWVTIVVKSYIDAAEAGS